MNTPRTLPTAGLTVLTGLAVVLLTPISAKAVVLCPSPDLPPVCGEYRTAADVHATFTNPHPTVAELQLSFVRHSDFQNPVITPIGPDELENFDSKLQGLALITPVSGPSIQTPFTLLGPVQVLTLGKTGNTTGTFDTEIISMSLTGTVLGIPVEITESPTRQSLGETTIEDVGGGLYHIDSFFDVFVELDIAGSGGVSQNEQDGSRVNLVPESGSTLAMLGLVIAGLTGVRRRRA